MSEQPRVTAEAVSRQPQGRPTITVKAGNAAVPFVLALLIGVVAFWGGTFYEREKHADYSVRVSGVPHEVQMTGAPDSIHVTGDISGIPREIAVKGTSLDGIVPKEIEVRTAAAIKVNERTVVAVTPQGEIYLIQWEPHPVMATVDPNTTVGAWKAYRMN
ncbi:MAG: hypothetical protein PVJ57_10325 [Phycisphaerae bacterium]|jgi:hypothetical protein